MAKHRPFDTGVHALDSFVNWNMPFGLNVLKHHDSSSGPSSINWTGASPSNVQVFTPADYRTPPTDHMSPKDYVSPRSVAIRQRNALDRADLFLRGRFDEAVSSMNDAEKAYVVCHESPFMCY